jgi:hypothetical protein
MQTRPHFKIKRDATVDLGILLSMQMRQLTQSILIALVICLKAAPTLGLG